MLHNKEYVSFVQEFTEELNRLRWGPSSYIPALQERLNSMPRRRGRTEEGPNLSQKDLEDAVHETIDYLMKMAPRVKKINPSLTLCKLSRIYACDGDVSDYILENGLEKVEWYTHSEIQKDKCGGSFERPSDLITDMLLDLDSKDKSRRENLFNREFTNFGVCYTNEGNTFYIVFSSDFTPGEKAEQSNVFNQPANYSEIEHCCTGKTHKKKKHHMRTALKTAAISAATKVATDKVMEKYDKRKQKKALEKERDVSKGKKRNLGTSGRKAKKPGIKDKIASALHLSKRRSSVSSSDLSNCSKCSDYDSDCKE